MLPYSSTHLIWSLHQPWESGERGQVEKNALGNFRRCRKLRPKWGVKFTWVMHNRAPLTQPGSLDGQQQGLSWNRQEMAHCMEGILRKVEKHSGSGPRRKTSGQSLQGTSLLAAAQPLSVPEFTSWHSHFHAPGKDHLIGLLGSWEGGTPKLYPKQWGRGNFTKEIGAC